MEDYPVNESYMMTSEYFMIDSMSIIVVFVTHNFQDADEGFKTKVPNFQLMKLFSMFNICIYV